MQSRVIRFTVIHYYYVLWGNILYVLQSGYQISSGEIVYNYFEAVNNICVFYSNDDDANGKWCKMRLPKKNIVTFTLNIILKWNKKFHYPYIYANVCVFKKSFKPSSLWYCNIFIRIIILKFLIRCNNR